MTTIDKARLDRWLARQEREMRSSVVTDCTPGSIGSHYRTGKAHAYGLVRVYLQQTPRKQAVASGRATNDAGTAAGAPRRRKAKAIPPSLRRRSQ